MIRERFQRLVAIVLLSAFGGSGLGLQELDALIHPAARDSGPVGVAHLDPLGGCGAHAEHCVLARSASVRPLELPAASRVPFFTSVSTVAPRPLLVLRASAGRNLLHTARPPPAAS
jgi:hypothetical protein